VALRPFDKRGWIIDDQDLALRTFLRRGSAPSRVRKYLRANLPSRLFNGPPQLRQVNWLL
jgi:hypothetical protein